MVNGDVGISANVAARLSSDLNRASARMPTPRCAKRSPCFLTDVTFRMGQLSFHDSITQRRKGAKAQRKEECSFSISIHDFFAP